MRALFGWRMIGACLLSLQIAALAQVGAGQSSMPPLHGEAVAFDAARARLVLLGGTTDEGWLEGTWEWDGGGWLRTTDASAAPPARAGHTMAFDPVGRRVVVFGGMHAPPVELKCDAWSYDGRAWLRIFAGACMTDRVRNASLVYDSMRSALVLVEGPAIAGDEPRPLKLWQWREADRSWPLLTDHGPSRTGFSNVAYDGARGVLVVPVLFGGPDAGVWEWDGDTWRHVRAAGPSTRQAYALTYDPRRRQVVLAGGQGSARGPYFDDLWAWDGERWTTIAAGGTGRPAGRAGASLVNDVTGNRLLYFGGYNDAVLRDLWTLGADGWTMIVSP